MNPRKLASGLLAIVVVVVVYLLLTSGSDDGYVVKAELPNAGGVRPNSSVKVAGVPGGTVKKLEVTKRDTVIVSMQLKDGVTIGRNASVEVRPTDLLGERYVALDVGDLNRPEPSGTMIPKTRSKLPVELDNVLNTFDGDTQTRIKILVNEFGAALGDRGKDLAKLLAAMPSSLDDARQLVTEIANEGDALKRLLTRGDQLTATIDPKKDQLASLVDQADTTLKALADRRDKIASTLDAAPGGLQALNRTLDQLRQASTDLRPASVDIKNAAQPLEQTLDALPGFESSARASLKAAKSAAPSLTKLGNKATGPLQALTPTLANVQQFSADLKPSLDVLDARAFEDAMWFAQNLGGRGLAGRDMLGNTLGARAYVNVDTVRGVLDGLFGGGAPLGGVGGPVDDDGNPLPKASSKGTTAKQRKPSDPGATVQAPPSAPATTQSTPAQPTTPSKQPEQKGLLGGLTDGLKNLLGGGTAGTNDKPSSSSGGVSGLLDSLLKP
ncbi:MlaD family protein [Patulibacter sp. NPDC049589]|uniref:MlaD family protein n=1 Tax=Patulibacter sp. NPDC049589 TaxID=3154731 RepID=UPI00342AD088